MMSPHIDIEAMIGWQRTLVPQMPLAGKEGSISAFAKTKTISLELVQDALANGANALTGGKRHALGRTYYEVTVLTDVRPEMRISQEEIFGPVVSVTTFKDEADALSIANDTLYGLGAGVWTRDGNRAFRMGRGIQAGRVWTNCYHHYPAHAAFGGYKQSGIGRENHKMMLSHYRQTKNLLVSYDPNPMGFF